MSSYLVPLVKFFCLLNRGFVGSCVRPRLTPRLQSSTLRAAAESSASHFLSLLGWSLYRLTHKADHLQEEGNKCGFFRTPLCSLQLYFYDLKLVPIHDPHAGRILAESMAPGTAFHILIVLSGMASGTVSASQNTSSH